MTDDREKNPYSPFGKFMKAVEKSLGVDPSAGVSEEIAGEFVETLMPALSKAATLEGEAGHPLTPLPRTHHEHPGKDGELSEDLWNALQGVYDWYGHTLPPYLEGATFPEFAVRSRELAWYIKDLIPLEIDHSAGTAYTDGHTIWLPSLYILPRFYEFFGIPELYHTAAACLTINGTQAHEALHCKITTFGMDDACRIAGNAKAMEYITKYQGFKDCINIIEDQYIEAYSRVNFPALTIFIDGKNHIMLGDTALDLALLMLTEQMVKKGQPPCLEAITVGQRLGMLCFAKTIELRHDDRLVWLEPLLEITDRAARHDLNLQERIALAVELWEKLLEESGGEEACEGSAATAGYPDASAARGAFKIADVLRAAQQLNPGSGASLDERVKAAQLLEQAIKALDTKDEGEPSSLTDHEQSTDDLVRLGVDALEGIPSLLTRDVMSVTRFPYDDTAKPSTEWRRFGQYLRYMRETKTSFGLAQDHGSMIVKSRLARILTDGKVLADRNRKVVKKGVPEIIILDDASGSMRGHTGSARRSLYLDVVDASYGMFMALMQAGVPTAVYAHTSTDRDNLRPLLYSIAAFRMPVFGMEAVTNGDFARRFNAMARLSCVENFDGIAIERVSHEFTSKLGTKVLIVLSDGAPVGGHLYGGKDAHNHTKNAITLARRRGIFVFSVSLVESVVSTNNALYGKENNLHGYGKELEPTLKAIAGAIAIPR